jgi:probable O-glycosylation ligase (exosortase A-associated)
MLGICPMILRAPILGVLTWIWIGLMNPQREVYGFLAGAGLNFIIAAITIFAWVISKERKTAPANLTMAVFAALVVWMCISTYFALVPERARDLFSRDMKIAALLVTVACIANTRMRLQAVVWAIVVSLGYFGVKGGLFVIASGGSYRVMGPPDSMIADNNHLGLAMVMLLPLINYLRVSSQMRLVRYGLMVLMVLTFISILGTYSRGALLALAAMGAVLTLRSRAGLLFGAAGAGFAVAAPHIMPAAWLERMSSINDADKDASFMGRVEAWRTSFNVAMHRVTGGGFASIESTWVTQTYPTPGGLTSGRAAHSIYFQVLGDLGFIGLALFLALIGSALLNTVMVLRATRGRPELRWANQLARMLQVGIIAFMVGGAALSMAFYDGFLLVLIMTAALHHVVTRGSTEAQAAAAAPKWKTAEPEAPALAAPTRPKLT